jgi:hypothetical protein
VYSKTLYATLLLLATCAAAQECATTREQLTEARAVADARQIRDRLNDPDSMRVSSFIYYEPDNAKQHFVCMRFRAKNEYAATVMQTFLANACDLEKGKFNDEDHADIAWPIMCKGEIVRDATEPVKAALKADRAKDE